VYLGGEFARLEIFVFEHMNLKRVPGEGETSRRQERARKEHFGVM
jgi:hypothetical protein